MKRFLKWLVIVLGGVLLLVLIAAVIITAVGRSRFMAYYDIEPRPLTVTPTEKDLARFRQLETQLGCTFCHGTDLGGGLVDAELGLYAPNLTTGAGGVGATAFTDADLMRAIRHGIAPDGRALILMPADQFSNLSEADLAAAVAFVRSFPPVDNEIPKTNPSLLLNFFTGLSQIPEELLIPARYLDHNAPYPAYVEPGETAAYGEYLTAIVYCTHCHRSDLRGGPFPYPDPDAPPVPNITSEGLAGSWSLDEFRNTLRTGITPAGRPLNPQYMDWPLIGQMSDEQLGAIYLYLQSRSSLATSGN